MEEKLKINSIKINGFGKIENKEIALKNGINIIKGENETGKTTILKFISSMLYGISKNKNGKEISDYEKYKPWKGQEYSGKINYELDNGKAFEVFRDFHKKNPQIYNQVGEEISNQYKIDKNKGNEFFSEQTNIDEENLFNTAIIEQEEIKLNKIKQNHIIQKISNRVSTGQESISYKKIIEKLNKKQLEEVGTERTTGRPINIVKENINRLNIQKQQLEKERKKIEILEQEKKEIQIQLLEKEHKIEQIKKVKQNKEKEVIEQEKINIKKQNSIEYENSIKEMNKKINQLINKKIKKINYVIITILIIINIMFYYIRINRNIIYGIGFITIIYILILFIKNRKINQLLEHEQIQKEKTEKMKKIKDDEIMKDETEIKNRIKNENKKILDSISIYLPNNNYEEILKILENEEQERNRLQIEMSTLLIKQKEIKVHTDKILEIEEEMENQQEQLNSIIELNNIINITKTGLEEAYEEMKNRITPEFIKDLTQIIKEITNNKYNRVKYNDEQGIMIELENGNCIHCELLSTGTMDQIYFAMRLSALKQITDETIPLILDEAFVYYDDQRLKNILEYLAKEFQNNQIILLTCTDREIDILEKLAINYNNISI